jgi:hypothetical protein
LIQHSVATLRVVSSVIIEQVLQIVVDNSVILKLGLSSSTPHPTSFLLLIVQT